MPADSIVNHLLDIPPAWRDRTAFTSLAGSLSFEDLRQSMLGFSAWLAQAAGIRPGDHIALCLPKSLEAVQAIFGILATSAAYVPLQFDGPPARLAAILDSVKPRLLLTTGDMSARLTVEMGARLPATQILEASGGGRGLAALSASTANPIAKIDPGELAVVVFTSGSTGEPKGVMIAHRAVVIRVTPPFEWDEVLQTDRLIINAGLHYVAALDIFFPAATGCTAYLLSDQEAMFPDRVVGLMEREQTTIWKSTSTALRLLTEKGHLEGRGLSALRRVEFVGEPLSMTMLRRAMAALPEAQFLHRFGATESYRIAQYPVPRPLPEDMTALPLGRPNAKYRLSLRDEDGQEVAAGEPGEICVIGAPVMLGYWNDPDLTAAKRLDGRPDSFRTGDLATLGDDGLLRWAGRCDQVVKIRGHRIDLGEIEAVLRRNDAVQDCVAFACSGSKGDMEIRVAVLTEAAEEVEAELKLLCVKRLHAPARPARLLRLPKFPLLPSGKVDRQALKIVIDAD
jgi:amino acid adenylation domain-containing protein